MSSLIFLLRKNIKNRVLEVLRSPGKLAIYLLVIAAIIGFFVMSLVTRETVESFLDMVWLKGIFFALVALFFALSVSKGLKKGDAIFGMNDVNFLFVSPVNSRYILLYGIIRMMGMAFLAGLFILFQGNSLGMWFGINFGDLFLILFMFMLAVSLMQILSLLIYSFANGKPKRKFAVRIFAAVLFVPVIAAGIYYVAAQSGDILSALEALLPSPVTAWTPIVGWSSSAVFAFLSGEILTGVLFLAVMIAAGGGLVLIIIFSNPDYYEDVLVATETAFEKQRAKEEGTNIDEGVAVKKVKIITEPLKGSGANAIFYKHLRESFRANPLGLWGIWSVFITLTIIAVAVIVRVNGGGPGNMAIILQVVMWVQLFLVGMGRGLSELSSHYIYMAPASAFSKLVWSNCESVFKVTAESFVMFIAAGIILSASPLLTLAAAFAYISFTLMLIGIFYLLLRWTGVMANQGVLILIYMLAVFIIILPGLIPAMIIGFNGTTWGVPAGIGILALWQTLAALCCFWLSKGILHKCDMPAKSIWN